jgi:hypothetical protein
VISPFPSLLISLFRFVHKPVFPRMLFPTLFTNLGISSFMFYSVEQSDLSPDFPTTFSTETY